MAYTRLQMKHSVVIPALDEAANISVLLERLSETPGIYEVVVADGGSADGTPNILRSSMSRLVLGEPGRSIQFRAGASETRGEVLLSLHDDVWPPLDAGTQIAEAVEAGYIGETSADATREMVSLGRWLEITAPVYRRLGRYYGDSGIFGGASTRRVAGFRLWRTSSSSGGWRERGRQPTCWGP